MTTDASARLGPCAQPAQYAGTTPAHCGAAPNSELDDPPGFLQPLERPRAQEPDDLVGERIRAEGEQELEDRRGGHGGRDVGNQVDDAERLSSAHAPRQKEGQHQAGSELDRNRAERIPDRHPQRVEDVLVPLGSEGGQRQAESQNGSGKDH